MPNSPQQSIENNFSGGLKTEYTGLNFPENACTAASNCVFSIIGDVNRREGFDFEPSYVLSNLAAPSRQAINTYKWNNVGGDGSTQIVVVQIGSTLYFYLSSAATTASPLSAQLLASTVNLSSFLATNAVLAFDPSIEVQFTDGNGFLFVFHSQCDPIYVTYNPSGSTLTGTAITINTRDFSGIPEPGVAFNTRPASLTNEHLYNLFNQGWSTGGWTTTSTTTNTVGTGAFTWIVSSTTLPISVGMSVTAIGFPVGPVITQPSITGTVTSYVGNQLTITETSNTGSGGTVSNWQIGPTPNYINVFYTTAAMGKVNNTGSATTLNLYPSNAEQWWWYRNTNVTSVSPDGTFSPKTTADYVVLSNAQVPKGFVTMPVFIQDRTAQTGVPSLTVVSTTKRPTTGCWYQGRVFYSGVNDSQQATGDAPYYTWTEDIYFSKIVEDVTDFGKCYQQNDPTNDKLFNLLPSDGGVITIQGSGPIYKLFPLKFGILVFAANGIWFLGGSAGLGFTASDYTVVKISNVQSISGTSVVNVLGYPVFWNEEGIYQVTPAKQGGSAHSPDIALDVNNLVLGTILSFYQSIPLQSKKFARGDYDPLNYTIQWLYRSTNESDVTSRYQFDSALNINTYKGPFYPYSFTQSNTTPHISSVLYVASPGGTSAPESQFEYFVNYNNQWTFAQERDNTNWQDWNSTGTLTDYTSTFTTGYKLHGSAWKLWWLGYIWIFSNNAVQTKYGVRGLWNYSTSGNSGKWSTQQIVTNNLPYFGNAARRLKIRGHGLALQLQFNSVTGYPFNFAGWSMYENINASV